MAKTNSAQRLAIDIELIAGNLAAVDSTGAVIGAEFRLGSPVDPPPICRARKTDASQRLDGRLDRLAGETEGVFAPLTSGSNELHDRGAMGLSKRLFSL